jgi:hypothetical protein
MPDHMAPRQPAKRHSAYLCEMLYVLMLSAVILSEVWVKCRIFYCFADGRFLSVLILSVSFFIVL